jgi:hypothetical protein
MKSTSIFIIALIATLFTACSGKENKSAATQQPAATTPAVNAPAQTATTPAGTNAVHHYTCPNNCQGSGGETSGNCPVCGTAYVHNAAYHTQQQQQTAPHLDNPLFQQSPTATPPPTAEPAQNAAGVFHYTCSNGCAGGSGTAGNCAKCGAALAHNAAYHQ